MMFLNDVAWGETASHHLTEKRNRENAELKTNKATTFSNS